MNADTALQQLLDVSPQIEHAVVAERAGTALASSFLADDDRSGLLAGIAASLLEEAENARAELGREPVVQCEVATGDGSVFVVADQRRSILAITASEPTVGLVFYDLKTALRNLRDTDAAVSNGHKKEARA